MKPSPSALLRRKWERKSQSGKRLTGLREGGIASAKAIREDGGTCVSVSWSGECAREQPTPCLTASLTKPDLPEMLVRSALTNGAGENSELPSR